MTTRFIVATHNRNKLQEIRAILAPLPLQVLSLDELAVHEEVAETGADFAENALQKARAAAVHFAHDYVMADDSGLSVAALNGLPGIYSARYAGRETAYPDKICQLWADMEASGNPDRSARFICAVAVVRPDGSNFTVEGVMEGEIAAEMRGENGFGYDPVFYLPEYGSTSGELDPAEKNRISHRGRALREMAAILARELQ